MTAVTDHPDPAPGRDTDDASVPRIGGTDGVALIDASSWLALDPLVPLFDDVPADPTSRRYSGIRQYRASESAAPSRSSDHTSPCTRALNTIRYTATSTGATRR